MRWPQGALELCHHTRAGGDVTVPLPCSAVTRSCVVSYDGEAMAAVLLCIHSCSNISVRVFLTQGEFGSRFVVRRAASWLVFLLGSWQSPDFRVCPEKRIKS